MKLFWRLLNLTVLVMIMATCVYAIFKGSSWELMFSQMFLWVLAIYADAQILREELKETGAIQ